MTSAVASTTMLGMHVTGMPHAVAASRSTVVGQMAIGGDHLESRVGADDVGASLRRCLGSLVGTASGSKLLNQLHMVAGLRLGVWHSSSAFYWPMRRLGGVAPGASNVDTYGRLQVRRVSYSVILGEVEESTDA